MDRLAHKQALIDRLRQSEGEQFECDEEAILATFTNQAENQSTLAIKVLSIFGGLLATLTFLGFLGIAGLFDDNSGILSLGFIFIVAAIGLNKVSDKLIIDTFSVSIYVTGFILLSFGALSMDIDENAITVFIALIALIALFITQNYILSFISILTFACCFIFLIFANNAYDLIHVYISVYTLILAYLFLNEAQIITSHQIFSRLYNPLRIGVTFSLLFGLIAIGKRHLMPISEEYIWLSSIVMVAVIFYLIYVITSINEVSEMKHKVLIYLLSTLILASTIYAPAISGSIIIILLSFLVNYRTSLVIGVLAVIYFISQYYYDLTLTLLTKSIILFISGVMFLVFYFLTTKGLSNNEKL